jgi:hypothetical protein
MAFDLTNSINIAGRKPCESDNGKVDKSRDKAPKGLLTNDIVDIFGFQILISARCY